MSPVSQLPPPPGYGYGYGPAPYPGGQIEHPQGITILVLGILGVAVCQLIGPVAWIMGSRALDEIDRNPAAYSNRSYVNAGKILGIVGTCIGAAVILLYVVIFVVIAASSSGS
jgi:hypothetical protein